MFDKQLFLVDRFDRAIVNGSLGSVNVRDISLARDARISLFQHPDSEVIFPAQEMKAETRLRFGIGMLSSVWEKMQSEVVFSIVLRDSAGQETPLFSRSINPRRRREERCWLDHEVNLPPSSGAMQIILRTRVPKRKGSAWCWAAWANPQLIGASHELPPPLQERTQPLVVIVTSDALRMDHVGCYGSEVSTPNLDQLAAEGVRFSHARTQSSVSLGAYASLLSSRNPLIHGITGEWGSYPEHLLSLPTQFAAWGFHTIIAASEAELDDPERGFSRLFSERIPTIGHPAQAGEITMRRVLERLQYLPDRPTLLWIQLFDTHPPLQVRSECTQRYYSGDPTDQSKRHEPEKIQAIRGVESLADLLASIERMRAGEQQASITVRLRGTVDCLLGRTRAGPDLAEHLRAAPLEITRKLELSNFALWLDNEVRALEAVQRASPALLTWLEQLLPFLRSIEQEIVGWLDGVQDYRFALAQYKAMASYMDEQVGLLRQGLKSQGLDQHTSWIFTSPHGEALGEADTIFHHHLLHESCLRVPLILRPAPQLTTESSWTPGRSIGGICDLIDLYPTLLSAYALPLPSTLEGKSRWPEILGGVDIAPHLSYSVDRNAVAISVSSTDLKYWLSLAPHSVTALRGYQAGEHYAFKITGSSEQLADEPMLVPELADALIRWHDCQLRGLFN